QAIERALALSANGSQAERAYIQALAKRCPSDSTADGRQVDIDDKDAMGALVRRYPDDLDGMTLYAEALLNLHRYRWYDGAAAAEGSDEALGVLQAVLRRDPEHPLGNHLYVHLLDESPHPEHALASAYRLMRVAPGAGHLVHMGSHIFMSVGDYDM